MIDQQTELFGLFVADQDADFLKSIAAKIWQVQVSATECGVKIAQWKLNVFPRSGCVKIVNIGIIVCLLFPDAELIAFSVALYAQHDAAIACNGYRPGPAADGGKPPVVLQGDLPGKDPVAFFVQPEGAPGPSAHDPVINDHPLPQGASGRKIKEELGIHNDQQGQQQYGRHVSAHIG